MSKSQFSLLATKRFLPLFVTQFCGAFNDNAFKLAMLTLISYHLAESQTNSEFYQSLAAGIFTLPFFIFSALAGELADQVNKAKIAVAVKWWELLLMSLGAIALYFANIRLMFVVLFGMGLQSTFFGPIKYAILPEHLTKGELLGGNGLIEASTFIAILLGTVLGTLAIGQNGHASYAIGLVMITALVGLCASFFIPATKSYVDKVKLRWNIVSSTFSLVSSLQQHRYLTYLILAISWFWFVGAVMLTKLPDFTHFILNADSSVFSLFLALFSVGIAIGSLLINRLLKGKVSPVIAPFGLLGISVFSMDLYFASRHITHSTEHLFTLAQFLTSGANWRILIDFVCLAICGGIYIVPLYALLQLGSKVNKRAQMIAANNIINAFYMVIAAVATGILAHMGITIPMVFLMLAIVNAFMILKIVPLLKHKVTDKEEQ